MAASSDLDDAALSEPHHAPCAQQLRRGLKFLRFDPPLESRFRDEYVDLNIERFRFALQLGIVLIFVVAALDFATLPAAVRTPVALSKLLLMLPVPLLSLWVVYHPFRYRHAPLVVGAAIVTAGVGVSAVHAAAGLQGHVLPYDSLLLVVLFAYFISGLLLPWSAVCALLVTVATASADAIVGLPLKSQAYHLFHLLAANAIGLLGSFLYERTTRLNYLHTGAAEEHGGLDSLTNLSNRHVFSGQLQRRWQQAIDDQVALGLLLIDVDYFRRYNDSAGHVAADNAIRQIARCVYAASRGPIDVVSRLDDDEFALLLYAVDRNRIQDTARRILAEVDAMRMHHDDSPISDAITVSIGAHFARPQEAEGDELFLARAHTALIAAKDGDRHQIRFADDDKAESQAAPTLRAS